jgi:hypothetical protein
VDVNFGAFFISGLNFTIDGLGCLEFMHDILGVKQRVS